MICVTGAAGFIGSHILKILKEKNISNVLLCDPRDTNMMHPTEFLQKLNEIKPSIMYHMGAISSTTETNTEAIAKNNILFSCQLLEYCIANDVPLIYASSASVYGLGINGFKEGAPHTPLNYYAMSKSIFDQIVNQKIIDVPTCKIIGLRYFNVYGSGEGHKKDMASPIHKFIEQSKKLGQISIFQGSENFSRDFIHVSDVANITINSIDFESGIYNVGTGTSRSFKDVADIISKLTNSRIVEIPFPKNLIGKYQNYTCSDNEKISKFINKNTKLQLEEGIRLTYSE